MTPPDQTEPTIEVIEYPAGARFIGPSDDVVISAAKLKDFIAAAEQRARIDEVQKAIEPPPEYAVFREDSCEHDNYLPDRIAELEQSLRKEQA